MIKIDKQDCHGCHGCKNVCPVNAIEMNVDEEGFWYPKVNYSVCTSCGLCISACSALSPKESKSTRKGYAGYNVDLDIRMQSSSGGIFTLLANSVLKNDGIVFGAGFNNNNEVVHMGISDEPGLARLRGSKYVQSKIGNTYKECKNALLEGREVLFSGTPCQIAGLRSYLMKDYDNLLTMDFICHGVPSPLVWNKYIQMISIDGQVSNIKFRDKSISWEKFSLSYYANGKKFQQPLDVNVFMKAFLNDLCLRPSCYSCKSKTLNRSSDFTVADFWGINNVLPELNDNRGISLIITHNQKAEQLLISRSNELVLQCVDIDEAIKYNPSAIRSVPLNTKRSKFMKEVNAGNFESLVKKYTNVKLITRMIGLINRALKIVFNNRKIV